MKNTGTPIFENGDIAAICNDSDGATFQKLAMVLGNFQTRSVVLIWITVGQEPIAVELYGRQLDLD